MFIKFKYLLLRLTLPVLFLCASFSAFTQELEGVVLDAESNEPLPYVHIGVPGKNLGVISYEDGTFKLNLETAAENDSLKFSIIGYEPYSVPVGNLEEEHLTVRLTSRPIILKNVQVTGEEIKELEKFGRTQPTKMTSGRSGKGEFGWGGEWGIRINHENKIYKIQDVNFHMRFNSVDSALFRINIYRLDDGLPAASILDKEIFMTSYRKEKWVRKNLESENIVIDEDVIVSFEVIRIWHHNGENHLFFTHGSDYPEGGKYMRKSSFAPWVLDQSQPITLYLTGRVY